MTDNRKEQILEDLVKNFKRKVTQAYRDFHDLCDAAEIDRRDSESGVAAAFMEANAFQIAVITAMPPKQAGDMLAALIEAYRAYDAEKQAKEPVQ